MRVLDLFAGLGGWSSAFREAGGHEVVSVDLDPKFGTTLVADILTLRPSSLPGPWDLVLASPPCEAFSVATIGRNWTASGVPRTSQAALSLSLVEATVRLIAALRPRAFLIENPRAMLRSVPMLAGLDRRTVTYCQYGERVMKPTDLWGGFPPTLRLKPPCKPRMPCHEAAPRGAKTGTQGIKGAAARALVPLGLSRAVLDAMMAWPVGVVPGPLVQSQSRLQWQ